jgi:hypothetical protein
LRGHVWNGALGDTGQRLQNAKQITTQCNTQGIPTTKNNDRWGNPAITSGVPMAPTRLEIIVSPMQANTSGVEVAIARMAMIWSKFIVEDVRRKTTHEKA